jgi:hypothetical protein
MRRPPSSLDGADVLFWAWSGDDPFFAMKDTEGSHVADIFGLAICRYAKSNQIYIFSCDQNWEVQGDSVWDTPEEAMAVRSTQYDTRRVRWIPFDRQSTTSSSV